MFQETCVTLDEPGRHKSCNRHQGSGPYVSARLSNTGIADFTYQYNRLNVGHYRGIFLNKQHKHLFVLIPMTKVGILQAKGQ